MTIEPKFKINDFVQHKIQKPFNIKANDSLRVSYKFFEVITIHTETCSAGTQIFYSCRCFFADFESYLREDNPKLLDIGFSLANKSFSDMATFREDEIRPMSDEDKINYGLTN